jgi:hypothetical protein
MPDHPRHSQWGRSFYMESKLIPDLKPNQTAGSLVQANGAGNWRLEIPAGPKNRYRLAQVDDYQGLPRRSLHWKPPFRLSLQARASSETIPGTWGFGLWNNPFGMALLKGAEMLRLPALPNTAWFFFAAPPNYLSLRDNLPAQGGLAAVFRSAGPPAPILAMGIPVLPLLLWQPAARKLRKLARRFVQEDAIELTISVCEWHTYKLSWQANEVIFGIDGKNVLRTELVPQGPLGLVIWVDNQYAALPPHGKLGFGTLENPKPAWIEIRDLAVS